MQLGIESQIPDGLLAANALLGENSRLGAPTSTHTLHQGFEFAISSTYKGFQFRCSESASDPVVAPSKGILPCFVKGAAKGALGAVVVGGLAVGAVALGAPAAVVTGGLLVAGGIGGAITLYNGGSNIANGNYAAAAYNAGSLAGGAVVGYFGGGSIANGIKPGASSGWSLAADIANRYIPSLGSPGKWLGTGPGAASAGGAAAMAGSFFGSGGCGK